MNRGNDQELAGLPQTGVGRAGGDERKEGRKRREETELYVSALRFGILSSREQRFLTSPVSSLFFRHVRMVVNWEPIIMLACSVRYRLILYFFLLGKYLGPGSLRFDFWQIVKGKLSTGSGFIAEFSLIR
jgi:hypothetical protein